jgi:UDP-N-acetylglucosamine--N-acetylmuramyl-(pentapeptide) pyrophosphoryl-undecaprenol N-acetylglucosamine transferase
MTVILLAGGGTAGHVNPLLATADAIRDREPGATIIVLGTAEGLESRLVPERGYELVTIERLPFPRRLSLSALGFPFRLTRAVRAVRSLLRTRKVDVVVGFGGYAAAPAYLAAQREHIPIVVHEANALPGIANRLGSALTTHTATTFVGTSVRNAVRTGMPLRREIARLDRANGRKAALKHWGLDSSRPVLLVTGGSTGAHRINTTISDSIADIVAAGWQVIHTVGESRDFVDPRISGYVPMPYCDRMDLALAVADLVVARSGAATVSELAGLGIPAVFVPYPVGNGEQELNARDSVEAGAATICLDKDFTPQWVRESLLPLLGDAPRRDAMARSATSAGIRDGAERLTEMVFSAVRESRV